MAISEAGSLPVWGKHYTKLTFNPTSSFQTTRLLPSSAITTSLPLYWSFDWLKGSRQSTWDGDRGLGPLNRSPWLVKPRRRRARAIGTAQFGPRIQVRARGATREGEVFEGEGTSSGGKGRKGHDLLLRVWELNSGTSSVGNEGGRAALELPFAPAADRSPERPANLRRAYTQPRAHTSSHAAARPHRPAAHNNKPNSLTPPTRRLSPVPAHCA